MTNCPDVDVLVTIGAALEWHPQEALEHLAGCASCRDQLHRLAALRAALVEEVATAPGLTERVMQGIERAPEPTAVPGHRALDVVNPLLAGATTFFAILFVAAGTPSRLGVPVLVALVSAVATLVWNRSRQIAEIRIKPS